MVFTGSDKTLFGFFACSAIPYCIVLSYSLLIVIATSKMAIVMYDLKQIALSRRYEMDRAVCTDPNMKLQSVIVANRMLFWLQGQ